MLGRKSSLSDTKPIRKIGYFFKEDRIPKYPALKLQIP